MCARKDKFILFLCGIFQALALMTRFIAERMMENGHRFKSIYLCGGLQKNPFYVQAHADCLGLPVVVPDTEETVALGSAILASVAGRKFPTIQEAGKALAGDGVVVKPNKELKEYYDEKYVIFRKFGDLIKSVYAE